MNMRVEDALIDAHNAPRARFEAQRIAVSESVNLYPFEGMHVWIAFAGVHFLHCAASHAEAQTVVETALSCGAPYVTIEWCLPGRVVTETWAAAEPAPTPKQPISLAQFEGRQFAAFFARAHGQKAGS